MSESIGVRLRQAREERRLTLQQVAEATRVRVRYLEALEADDLSTMPSAAQARGFLRIYAEFLGLDVEALIREARQAEAAPPASPADLPTAPVPEVEAKHPNLLDRLRRRFAPKDAPSSPSAAQALPDSPSVPEVRFEPEAAPPPAESIPEPQDKTQGEQARTRGRAAAPPKRKPARGKKKA